MERYLQTHGDTKSMNKDTANLIKELRKQLWVIKYGKKHIKAKSPITNRNVILSISPSDYRSMKNTMARLKRHGYIDPDSRSGGGKSG